MAADRAEDAVAQDEDAEVVAGMADGALNVEHGAQPFEGLKRPPRELAVRHADQAPSFRAEERLDHDIAPQRLERLQRVGRRFSRPGRGDGQAGGGQCGQREVLVDGRLDGAGGIEHGDSQGLEAMQGVHPEDDLLQAPRRHHPHQHPADARQVDSPRLEPLAAGSEPADDPGKRDRFEVNGQRPRCPVQVLHVPPHAGDQSHQFRHEMEGGVGKTRVQEENERTSTSSASSPKAWTQPVSRLWKTTSPGLKRCGSTA